MIICFAILIISSVLWIPFGILYLIDKLISLIFKRKESDYIDSFAEIIFAFYGLAGGIVYLSHALFNKEEYEEFIENY